MRYDMFVNLGSLELGKYSKTLEKRDLLFIEPLL